MIYQTFKGMTATEYQAYLRRQAQDAAEAALYAARQCTDPTRALCEALMAENGNEHFHEIIKGLLARWNAEAVDGDNSAHFDGMRRLAEAAEDITFDYGLEPDGYRLRAKMQVHWPVATFIRARGAAWNACKGIPTEALQAGAVADMLEALRAWKGAFDALFAAGYPLMQNGAVIDHTALNEAEAKTSRAIAKIEGLDQ